jgi:hypothetical protein
MQILRELPGVTVRSRPGHASFHVSKKVFAFTRPEGVAMKLPKEKIAELAGNRNVSMLVMGKRVMKEWVVVAHKNPGAYKKDLELFKISASFVASELRGSKNI